MRGAGSTHTSPHYPALPYHKSSSYSSSRSHSSSHLSAPLLKRRSSGRSTPLVLHGKVHYVSSDSSEEEEEGFERSFEEHDASHSEDPSSPVAVSRRKKAKQLSTASSPLPRPSPAIPPPPSLFSHSGRTPPAQGPVRPSTYAQLAHEMLHFQRLVADLERLLRLSGESPEAAWRCRILIRSAQETDNDLWRKLYDYENSLLLGSGVSGAATTSTSESRSAQSACVKLHRDFKRIHHGLLQALSDYERRQSAEISQLGAVQWNNFQHHATATATAASSAKAGERTLDLTPGTGSPPQEDYFDRAMRQAELEKMNQSMHKVNDIYNELATLVDLQQPQIDRVQANAEESQSNVQKALHGCMEHESLCGSLEKFGDPKDWDFPFEALDLVYKDDEAVAHPETESVEISAEDEAIEVERVVEEPMVKEESACEMACGTLPVDLMNLQREIFQFGRHVIWEGNHLNCGAITISQSGNEGTV